MEKHIKKDRKILKIFFWCSVWLSIFIICMKIYYTDLNLAILTEMENFIIYSPLHVLIILCFIPTITFLILLKLKKEKIFQNKKIIICTFFVLLVVTVTILIINNRIEGSIIVEGEMPSHYQMVTMFNSRFDRYTGTDISLPVVRQLITNVISNNSRGGHSVNITYNGKIYIEINDMSKLIRNTINDEGKYNIYCEYDVEGYINNIILEKK